MNLTGKAAPITGGDGGIGWPTALGVRINAVCPGPVEARMMRSLESQRNPNDPEGVYAAGIPSGRYATPEEIAGAVLYLSSDLSGDVTGTHIVIDGGRSASGGVAPVKRR